MMILLFILALLHLQMEHCRMHVMRVEGFFTLLHLSDFAWSPVVIVLLYRLTRAPSLS